MSIRLYVGNLPEEVSRQELEAIFAESSPLSIKIITDRRTNKCRGFGFVTVKNDEEADAAIEKYNGAQLQDNSLRVERAQPRTNKADEGSSEAPATSKRKGGGGKARRGSGSASSDSVQPDPRWASQLEKLKDMLATQTTNS